MVLNLPVGEEGGYVQDHTVGINCAVALSMSLDCSTEVYLWRHMQFHAVGGRVEDADVVSVIVRVLGVLATLVVNLGGGAVEKVFSSLVAFG